MADRVEFQPPVPAMQAGASLIDMEVGAAKEPAALLGFAPRLDRLAVVAAIMFQLFILVAMILGRTVPFVGAQIVLLKVEPVDPRDLLRGDYVNLGYAISRTPGGQFPAGQSVYATLVADPDGRHFRLGQFLHEPPSAGTFIRGKAAGYGRATYGIESYYVQEGKGHEYESATFAGRLWAEVALSGDGSGALKRLVIE